MEEHLNDENKLSREWEVGHCFCLKFGQIFAICYTLVSSLAEEFFLSFARFFVESSFDVACSTLNTVGDMLHAFVHGAYKMMIY